MASIPINAITVGERRRAESGDIAGLAESLQRYGLLHPVVIDREGNLVCGGRRLAAAVSLGWTAIDVRSLGELSDNERRAIELEENIRRKDLTPYEISRDIVNLVEVTREIAKEEAETCTDSVQVSRVHPRGPTVQPGSYRDIAERTGVPVATIRDAEAHVTAVEQFPELDALPRQPAIDTAAALADLPASDQADIRAAIAELPPEQRRLSPAVHQLLTSSESVEWYTPARYLEAARAVLGAIDLDPASCDFANETVQAERFYTEAEDGLSQPWQGRVFLNPPYGRSGESNQARWSRHLRAAYESGDVTAAILLVNASTGDQWFRPLWDFSICFPDHRIRFESEDGEQSSPTHSNAFVYLGPDIKRFIEVFSSFGVVARRIHPGEACV